jgi:hypothetical protein
MLGRFRRGDGERVGRTEGTVATRERDAAYRDEYRDDYRDEPVRRDGVAERAPRTTRGAVDPVTDVRAARARQREQFGGFSWGADFFGWLVALGIAALLTGIIAAAGAATALTNNGNDVNASNSDTIGVGGGIAILVVLAIAYYAGGYVAGRMSRFDGARQGVGVWVVGLIVTIVLAVAGAILGSEYNVFSQLNLPRIPVDEGTLTTGGIIALVIALVVTLVTAMAGGKVGERFHRKVDRVGYDRI